MPTNYQKEDYSMADKNSKDSAIKSYMQNLICITASLAVFALSGCAAPQTVLPALGSYLSPQCKALMTSEALGQYGHMANSPFGKAVFAVATEGDKQVCGLSDSVRDDAIFWENLDSAALGRCNVLRPQYGISSPCGIFAHNWDILWTGSIYPGPMPVSAPAPTPVITPQQQLPNPPTPQQAQPAASLDDAKCADLGFKAGTETFGECVIKLSR
jgi:hypothetical protein